MPYCFLSDSLYLSLLMTMDSPTSKEEFQEALDELTQRAYQNGVEVADGGYELIHPDRTTPDWDMTIIRMK